MRVLGIAVALAAVALISGLAAYEWRSPPPVRVEPVELLPAPEREPRRELPGKRKRADESAKGGASVPTPSSSGDGAAPVAPEPTPAGGGDDDGGDDDGGDDDDDGGDDDGGDD